MHHAYLEARLAIAALTMALKARRPAPDSLIHHSDRGVQYACGDSLPGRPRSLMRYRSSMRICRGTKVISARYWSAASMPPRWRAAPGPSPAIPARRSHRNRCHWPRRSARCRPRAAPVGRYVKFTPDCRRNPKRRNHQAAKAMAADNTLQGSQHVAGIERL